MSRRSGSHSQSSCKQHGCDDDGDGDDGGDVVLPDGKEGDVVPGLSWQRPVPRHEAVLGLQEVFVILRVELQHPAEVRLARPLQSVLPALLYDDTHSEEQAGWLLTADCSSSPPSAECNRRAGGLSAQCSGQGRFKHNQYCSSATVLQLLNLSLLQLSLRPLTSQENPGLAEISQT